MSSVETSIQLGDFSFAELKEVDLELVRDWRNSESVRKWMYTEDEITAEGQKEWFRNRKKRYDFLFQFKEEKVGLIYVYNIDESHKRCEFGFYIGNQKFAHSGFGAVMEYMILEWLFFTKNFERVGVAVIDGNAAVLSQHRRFGFQDEGRLRNFIKKEKVYDVFVQGLLVPEWVVAREKVKLILEKSFQL